MCIFSFLFGKPNQNLSNQKSTQHQIKQNISEKSEEPITYIAKPNFLTKNETSFLYKLNKAVNNNKFIIQPQINLASVIEKQGNYRYQNELYRNIDYGIFDKNYKLKLLIELNDTTHKKPDRAKRDSKVREICKNANMPLITFYTDKPNNPDYLHKRIKEYLS